jgi:hypothetical protein
MLNEKDTQESEEDEEKTSQTKEKKKKRKIENIKSAESVIILNCYKAHNGKEDYLNDSSVVSIKEKLGKLYY